MISRILMSMVLLALIAFVLGIAELHPVSAVWRHVLFAVGVAPLILAAMLYFVPVLTRTSSAPSRMLWLPVAAAGLGVSTVLAFIFRPEIIVWIAGMLLLVVTFEFAWIWQRRDQTLGRAHPGLYWYLAALAALLLALLAIVLREMSVDYGSSLRRFHLHINLLGFLGLTAIGTLRVLLPTAFAVEDSAAYTFLRVQLPYAVAATLCIALGAAVWPPLSWLGGVLWLWPAAQLLRTIRCSRLRSLGVHHSALALSASSLGWLLVLLAGVAHGFGLLAADALMWLLVFLFLLPLVTGASSYLLPLWRWPGKLTQKHTRMRAQLMRFSSVRVLAFYVSAVLALLAIDGAQMPAVIALLTYVAQIGHAFLHNQRDAAQSR